MRRLVPAAALCAALAGCGAPSAAPPAGPPAPVALPVPAEYVLRAGDELTIAILEEKDSTRKVPVRPDGRISYDYVGDLQASGRTIAEVRQDIQERLKSLYVAPHVSVIGTAFTARVYVLGEVTAQRSVPYQQGLGLVAAVAEVGGLNTKGRHHQVLVVRGGFSSPSVIPVDYAKVVRGRAPDVPLLAGDIVFVPATFLTDVERISTQIVPFFQTVVNAEAAEEAARNLGKAAN